MRWLTQFLPPRRRPARRRPLRAALRFRPNVETLETRLAPANVDVLTWHYDNTLSGYNNREELLTTSNVNRNNFGRLFTYPTDGFVFAQPLYKGDLDIVGGNGPRNVVFAATEGNSVYAFDADNNRAGPNGNGLYWQRTFVDRAGQPPVRPGWTTTTMPSPETFSGDIVPQIGITGTPVIDGTRGIMYVIVKTREVQIGGPANEVHYIHRLHALDIRNGTVLRSVVVGDTTSIGGSIDAVNTTDIIVTGANTGRVGDTTAPRGGAGSGEIGGAVRFNSRRALHRSALVLAPPTPQHPNGLVIMDFASHGDNGPYRGWVIGYDPITFQLRQFFLTTLDARGAGIWQSGSPVAIDQSNNIFFATGNAFGVSPNPASASPVGPRNLTEAVVSLRTNAVTGQLELRDWFIPFNWQFLDQVDADLGSGGTLVLPDEVGEVVNPTTGQRRRLIVETGKEGKIYLLDRDDLGQLSPNQATEFNPATQTGRIRDTLIQGVAGVWGSPAFRLAGINPATGNPFGYLYYHGSGDFMKVFRVENGRFVRGTEAGQSIGRTENFWGFPGAQPTLTSNGLVAGSALVWELQSTAFGPGGPTILYAYEADPVNGRLRELYRSNDAQTGIRDRLGPATKFVVPAITNGKVFAGTANTLEIFGLFPQADVAPEAPSSLVASADSSTQITLAWINGAIAQHQIRIERSLDGVNFSQIQIVGGDATRFVDINLTPGTQYFYRIRAENNIGLSEYSDIASARTRIPAPVLTLENVCSTQIDLSWTNNPAFNDHFEIERSTDGGQTFFTIAVLPAGRTTYSDTDLERGTYTYRVRAFSASGETSLSAPRTATIGPSVIDFSTGFIAPNTANLQLNGTPRPAVIPAGATFLTLTNGDDTGQAVSAFWTQRVGVGMFRTEFTFRLHDGTDPRADGFAFVIHADPRGASAVGPSGGGLGFGPDQPNLAADPRGIRNSVAIKFDIFNNAGEGAGAFPEDPRLANSTGIFTDGRSPSIRRASLPAVPTPLIPDRDVNLSGPEFPRDPVTGVPIINLANQENKRAIITYDGTTLILRIEDRDDPTEFVEVPFTVDIPGIIGTDTAFVGFTGGTGGLTVVQDIFSWHWETQATIPGAPSDLRVVRTTDTEVFLAWRCNSFNEDGFVIERSRDGTEFEAIDTVGPNRTSYTDTPPSAGIWYYRVRAFNEEGQSAPSNVAVAGLGPITVNHLGGFFSNSDLQFNRNSTPPADNPTGFIPTPTGTFVARLTTNINGQAGNFFTRDRVGIGAFSNTFTFRIHTGSGNPADGMTFIIQADPRGAGALGVGGGELGYTGIVNSVAIKFDIWPNTGSPDEGNNSTGIFTGGRSPSIRQAGLPATFPDRSINLTGTGIVLKNPQNQLSEHVFRVTMIYDGADLQVTIVDTETGARATQSYAVNIPALVGSETAFVGFGGGTGGENARQDVLTWAFTSLPGRPATPGNVRATAAFGDRIDVAWNAIGSAAGYRVERSTGGGPFTTIAEVPAGLTGYSDTGLAPGTYSYRVRAFNENGSSAPSNAVNIRLGVDHSGGFPSAAGLATNGSATILGGRARLTQNVNGQAGSLFTTAQVGIGAFNTAFTFQLGPRSDPPADGLTFVLQSVGPNALGGGGGAMGYQGISSSVAVKFDFFKPGPPNQTSSTGIYVNGQEPGTVQFGGAPQINLVPSGIDFRNGNRFRVELSYNGTTLTETITDLDTPPTLPLRTFTTTYTINLRNFVGGETAFVGFTAGTGGLNAEQNILNWTYSAVPFAPNAPGNLRVTTAGSRARLTWNASGAADGYRVERADNGGGFTEVAVLPLGATSHDDPDVTPGEHSYRVQALSAQGNSAFSNPISVTLGAATFDQSAGFTRPGDFTVNGNSTFLANADPVGVFAAHNDIGGVAARGGATFAGGTYTVRASGADIWDNNDQFHFVYRPLVGDGEIIARVVTLGNTDFWSKAGVMIRDTLAFNSPNAFMMNAHPGPESEAGFQWRTNAGGPTTDSLSGFGSRPRPVWVRLVRSGNQFSGFSRTSEAGSWVQQGPTVTITMGTTVFAGLALTAHNNSGVINTSTFDNVTVVGATAALPPTLARLTQAANGQAGSIFTNTQLGIAAFNASFNFRVTPGTTAQLADGFTFTLQSNNPTALGQFGAGMGYGQENPGAPLGITNSVAVKFDFFKNNVSSVGVYTNGQLPGTTQFNGQPQIVTSPAIEFRSGREFRVDLSYNGTTLTGTITDVLNPAVSGTASVAINIGSFVGSDTAFVGFTGGTGGLNAVQDILNFRFESL